MSGKSNGGRADASCTSAAEQRKIEIAQQQGEPFEMTMIMPDPKNPQAHPASAWPASFQIPPYPNCSIYKVAVFENGPKKGQGEVVFSAKLSPSALEDWYREKLIADGWSLEPKDPKAPGLISGVRNGLACYMTISDYGSDNGGESTATVDVASIGVKKNEGLPAKQHGVARTSRPTNHLVRN